MTSIILTIAILWHLIGFAHITHTRKEPPESISQFFGESFRYMGPIGLALIAIQVYYDSKE